MRASHRLTSVLGLGLVVALASAGCGDKDGKGGGDDLCGKAAAPLAGIALLKVANADGGVKLLRTLEDEIAGACRERKLAETAKDALTCYDANRKAIGFRLFKSCPAEPGEALALEIAAKH